MKGHRLCAKKHCGFFSVTCDALARAGWYQKHLGLHSEMGYVNFPWRDENDRICIGHAAWTVLPVSPADSQAAGASLKINYAIEDLDVRLKELEKLGAKMESKIDFDQGRIALLTVASGQQIELWEPKVQLEPWLSKATAREKPA